MWTVKKIMRWSFHIGLREPWKLCLNLCIQKWLRADLNLVNTLIYLGIWLFLDSSIEFKILFLWKILWLYDFWIFLLIFFLSKKMSHFERRNIFGVSCKLWSTRHRNNIEEVCRRLLVKDLIKTVEFSIPSYFLRDSCADSW